MIPKQPIWKHSLLSLDTKRPQSIQIGSSTSSTITLSPGVPHGCVLGSLPFILMTHDCAAMCSLNHFIKFVDETTVMGLISKNNESAYRKRNNLPLNVDKIKEMVVDFGRT